MYLKLADIEISDGQQELNILKEIQQSEIDEFFDSQKIVREYKHIKNLYNITVSNGNELYGFLSTLYSNHESLNGISEEKIYLEGNRLIANYCSFIGMYIDQIEKVLTKDKEKLESFRLTCNELYDEKFEYRFFVLLRNFVMHYSLPFTLYSENFNGKSLEFSKKHLLSFSKWKHVKADLESMKENIDIRSYIEPMNINLTLLLWNVILHLSKEIIDAYQESGRFLAKHKVKNPAIVRYESKEKYELRSGPLNFTPIDLTDLISAFDDVRAHPHIDVKINN